MTTSADAMTSLPLPRRQRGPWMRRLMLFMICVVLTDSLFGERGLSERQRAIQASQQAIRDLSAIRNENAGLREQIRRLRTDPATIELIAREELGLIHPGELLFRFTR